jgi:glucose/mannose-6-phosphate isomerase
MQQFIEEFPQLIAQSIAAFDDEKQQLQHHNPGNVLISGLGGSGIGGTIASEWASSVAKVPVLVSKDYEVPSWANSNTLFIASSYSGGTEETLSALRIAQQRGCQILCISSGGQLADIAAAKGYPLFNLPTGYPPRAAFPFALAKLTAVLIELGILPESWREVLPTIPSFLEKNIESIRTEARDISLHFQQKIPIIYSATGFEGVAIRWRQQINENSKMLCWHHVLPEMNHNELVGWAGGDARFSALFLRSGQDHYRTLKRMELSAEIMEMRGAPVRFADAAGEHILARSLYLILLGDWVSLELANFNKVDPTEVYVITGLKNALAKLD